MGLIDGDERASANVLDEHLKADSHFNLAF